MWKPARSFPPNRSEEVEETGQNISNKKYKHVNGQSDMGKKSTTFTNVKEHLFQINWKYAEIEPISQTS